MKKLLAISICTLICFFAFGQKEVTVKGRLLDHYTTEPIVGAQVFLNQYLSHEAFYIQPAIIFEGKTDRNGQFEIQQLEWIVLNEFWIQNASYAQVKITGATPDQNSVVDLGDMYMIAYDNEYYSPKSYYPRKSKAHMKEVKQLEHLYTVSELVANQHFFYPLKLNSIDTTIHMDWRTATDWNPTEVLFTHIVVSYSIDMKK